MDGACIQNIVCYAKGTLILMEDGFVPIEDIGVGDMVMTKGKIVKNRFVEKNAEPCLEPVTWVGKFKVNELNNQSRPVCIKKYTFNKHYPFKDLYVSPNHSLLFKGRMVLAKHILNGETIYQDRECESVEYYHLECKHHCAIFANGVLSESYLDVKNRNVFKDSLGLGSGSGLKLKKSFIHKLNALMKKKEQEVSRV